MLALLRSSICVSHVPLIADAFLTIAFLCSIFSQRDVVVTQRWTDTKSGIPNEEKLANQRRQTAKNDILMADRKKGTVNVGALSFPTLTKTAFSHFIQTLRALQPAGRKLLVPLWQLLPWCNLGTPCHFHKHLIEGAQQQVHHPRHLRSLEGGKHGHCHGPVRRAAVKAVHAVAN